MNQTKQKELSRLAQRIRQARESSHISQKELGESIGVSDKSISSYEKGRSAPSFAKLKKIADKTNKPITYFTDDQTKSTDILEKLLSIENNLEEIKKLLQEEKQAV